MLLGGVGRGTLLPLFTFSEDLLLCQVALDVFIAWATLVVWIVGIVYVSVRVSTPEKGKPLLLRATLLSKDLASAAAPTLHVRAG